MSADVPERMLDPICDMVVSVADAQAKGLTAEHEGRSYAFCSSRCVRAFGKDPATWAAKADAALLPATDGADAPVIDQGLRRWYASCRCCLKDAYPAVVAALDAERKAAKEQIAGPGICEVAEGMTP